MCYSFFFLLATLLQKLQIGVDKVLLQVEIAKTDQEQEKGLMGREILGENEGMLFIYQDPEVVYFWMKDTPIPLSIGFFDEKKRLFQIEDMLPLKTFPSYKSRSPAQYALEVNRGWFEKNGISLGAELTYEENKEP